MAPWGIWSLGSGAMLAWGAAALIPLAIHLWSRRRHQEISWAAMTFLLAAMRKHSRRIRIEQWVLLAVRMLLLGLLALALADPAWSWVTGAGPAARAGGTHYFFVVDTSYSMGFRERDRTLLQDAQEQMRRLVEQSAEGDGYSLLLLESPPRAVLSDVAFDRGEVLRRIERLQVSHTGADLTATLAALEQSARLARERYPRLVRQQIVLLTDLGQNTWSDVALPANRATIARLATQAEWTLYDVGQDRQTNQVVTDFVASNSITTSGNKLQIAAEIQAFGTESSVASRIEFLVNGQVVHAQEVQLPAHGRQTVRWEWSSEAAGDQVLSARIPADNLQLDNQRWLVLPVRKTLSVLCIEGEPGAAEFVGLALNPESREGAAIHATIAGESALLERDLNSFDGLFLCNVGRFTPHEAAALHRYVERGGGLVVSLGDQVQADHYSRELAAEVSALLPARVERIETGEWFLDPLEYRHPLVAPFRGRERAGLLTVPIWRYFRLQPLEPATIALAFNSGHPAVVETQIGRGRSILVATALSPSSMDRSGDRVTPWNALPAWPSFPPLVHGLLQMSTRGRAAGRNVLVGSPLRIDWRTADRAATVIRPDQLRERLDTENALSAGEATYADTSRCGAYQVEIEGTPARNDTYAVNLDVRESNLRRLDQSALPMEWRDVRGKWPQTTAALPGDNRQQLFRPLLMLVATLLLVEQLLAVLFARRSV